MQVLSYNICISLTYCTWLNTLSVYTCSHKWQNYLISYSRIVFHIYFTTSIYTMYIFVGFPDGLVVKNPAANAGAVDLVCLFGSSHSNRCEMIYHCDFDFLFPDDCCCRTTSHIFDVPLCVFFGKMSIPFLCPFLMKLFISLVMSHMSSLHILHINPLSDIPWWLRP